MTIEDWYYYNNSRMLKILPVVVRTFSSKLLHDTPQLGNNSYLYSISIPYRIVFSITGLLSHADLLDQRIIVTGNLCFVETNDILVLEIIVALCASKVFNRNGYFGPITYYVLYGCKTIYLITKRSYVIMKVKPADLVPRKCSLTN